MTSAPSAGAEPSTGRWRVGLGAVAGLACAVRLLLVGASPGGFRGTYGYDSGVYFDAANQLLHGRLPYADFTLLHPPGLMLALTPFAALARLTTDHLAFMVGSAVFVVIGAANAVLVAALGRRTGLSARAALLGGFVYAVWLSPAAAEIGIRLEPLGTLCFLAGLFLLVAPERAAARTVVAGVLLGLAPTVKIWWIVPVAVSLGWLAATSRHRPTVVRALAGAAGALAVVLGPFFLAAAGPMWRMIVLDQLGRHRVHGNPLRRVGDIVSLPLVLSRSAHRVLPALVLLGAAALAARAWRTRTGRLAVPLAVAQVGLLLWSPTYFFYYAAFPAAALALVLAAGADGRPSRRRRPAGHRVVPALAGAVVVLLAAGPTVVALGRHYPTEIRPVARPLPAVPAWARCVAADSPQTLVQLDVLNRNLSRGCPDWGDVSGRTYDVDAAPGAYRTRPDNPRWQASIRRYLLSADVFVIARGLTGFSAATLRLLTSRPVVASRGRLVLREGCGADVSRRWRTTSACAAIRPAPAR